MVQSSARCGVTSKYELFTSERSTRSLYRYQKLDYHTFRAGRLTDKVTIVYLEKMSRRTDTAH
jgi:hypothetical protein